MTPNPLSLVTLPLRATIAAVRLGLSLVDELLHRDGAEPAEPRERPRPAWPPRTPPPAERATPAVPGPAAPEAEAAPGPEPAHVVEEEDELVAEVADPGAEEPPGASLTVEEPWEGYRRMRADEIGDRMATATREELAVLELYEMTHRRRKTVLAEAERRLKLLSSPRPG